MLEGREGDTVTISYLTEGIGQRSFALLNIFMVLPFLQPIPVPVLSVPFGVVMALSGFSIMVNARKVWLPRSIGETKISKRALRVIRDKIIYFLKRSERLIKPRMVFLCEPVPFRILTGSLICFFGFFFSIPWPIPATNLVPGIVVLLLSLGLMQKDGVLIILGYAFVTAILILSIFVFPQVISAIWANAKNWV